MSKPPIWGSTWSGVHVLMMTANNGLKHFAISITTYRRYIRMNNNMEQQIKAVVDRVYSSEIIGISEALSLQKIPALKWDATGDEGIMHIQRWYSVIDVGYSKLIKSTSTDYIIHVDTEALTTCINTYRLMFGKGVEEDLIVIFLAHECRHIWQVESSWWNGKLVGNRNAIEHGSLPEEQDANAFAIGYVRDERVQALAKYVKFLQDRGNTARHGDIQKIYKKTVSIYNPSHNKLLEYLGL